MVSRSWPNHCEASSIDRAALSSSSARPTLSQRSTRPTSPSHGASRTLSACAGCCRASSAGQSPRSTTRSCRLSTGLPAGQTASLRIRTSRARSTRSLTPRAAVRPSLRRRSGKPTRASGSRPSSSASVRRSPPGRASRRRPSPSFSRTTTAPTRAAPATTPTSRSSSPTSAARARRRRPLVAPAAARRRGAALVVEGGVGAAPGLRQRRARTRPTRITTTTFRPRRLRSASGRLRARRLSVRRRSSPSWTTARRPLARSPRRTLSYRPGQGPSPGRGRARYRRPSRTMMMPARTRTTWRPEASRLLKPFVHRDAARAPRRHRPRFSAVHSSLPRAHDLMTISFSQLHICERRHCSAVLCVSIKRRRLRSHGQAEVVLAGGRHRALVKHRRVASQKSRPF